ncbi:MAG TPA: YfbU family protein [Longimicrobium sp.]|nr:YfbU family protein [Longimicrobium sp.]
MKLSRIERWTLANQYRILAALEPQNAATYNDYVVALERGYATVIDRIAERISRDDTDHKESEEVDDILEMFDGLQRAFRTVEDPYGIEPYMLQFPGFDGKTERDYLGYAHFALERERRHQNLASARDLDTAGTPMLRQYRRMLDEWKRRTRSGHPLERADILAILEARKK